MLMERISPYLRQKYGSPSCFHIKHDFVLPPPGYRQPQIRLRTLLGHCLYRRVLIWTVTLLLVLCLTVYSSGGLMHTPAGGMLNFAEFGKDGYWSAVIGVTKEMETHGTLVPQGESGDSRVEAAPISTTNPPHWLKYRHLEGYFRGLKALVSVSDYIPEYPREGHESPYPLPMNYTAQPTPSPVGLQPNIDSSKHSERDHAARTCFIDTDEQVPVPSLYAYNGIVQGQPKPVLGSHDLLGLRADICWDRFGRYGPYGLGYGYEDGGVYRATDVEKEGNEAVWSRTGKINYTSVDWAEVQDRCYEKNNDRFSAPDEEYLHSTLSSAQSKQDRDVTASNGTQTQRRQKIDRVAVVLRAYVGYQWTQHAILNLRAMISELSLRSGGKYAVHLLLHVRDDESPIWADGEVAQRILDDSVPAEFHGLCALWSEAQMRLIYPGGDFGGSVENPSGQDLHGVYRGAHMPLQRFAAQHPEYAHFWNWEMDMRWLGDYRELFDGVGRWARGQSRVGLWERNQKYYIPSVHGSWEEFTEQVHAGTKAAGRRPVFGPVLFPGRRDLRPEGKGGSFLPADCAKGSTDSALCGVGEEADLITLNPIFDPEDSGWVFASDVTGYGSGGGGGGGRHLDAPPRRAAIITAGRLSRRLLAAMHEETWRMRHAMFSEMFPATVALHHGLKAVYAPHPVYLDREWDVDVADRTFNGGRDGSTSGRGSPFDYENEHNHKGSSWYFDSEFAGLLWRRWLGYAQIDGRGADRGRDGQGTLRGGKAEEEALDGTGRMCLRSMLVHPIKWEHPDELPAGRG